MTNPIARYSAHGKLLISGEYLVLHGALALAVPLQKGQTLEVYAGKPNQIIWEAYEPSGKWMYATWDASLRIIESSDTTKAEFLTRIFQKILELHPPATKKLFGKRVVTQLEFDPLWGWGSSSTLLSCLAQWMGIDGFKLLRETTNGSGYDLACATANEPIFYRLTAKGYETEVADFNPPFTDKLWLIHLGNKVHSAKSIIQLPKGKPKALAEEITQLTHLLAGCTFGDAFASLLPVHEALIGEYLSMEPVQNRLFPDFNGQIKSLGAWGGDFIMAYSNLPEKEILKYFMNKGYSTVFNYSKIILNNFE